VADLPQTAKNGGQSAVGSFKLVYMLDAEWKESPFDNIDSIFLA